MLHFEYLIVSLIVSFNYQSVHNTGKDCFGVLFFLNIEILHVKMNA